MTNQVIDRWYVGVFGDAEDCRQLQKHFPDVEIVSDADDHFVWHPSFDGLAGEALYDAARVLYRTTAELGILEGGRRLRTSAHAYDLRISADGTRERRRWPGRTAMLHKELEGLELASTSVTGAAAIAHLAGPPVPQPAPQHSMRDRVERMSRFPDFALAMDMLGKEDSTRDDVRRAKEYVLAYVKATGATSAAMIDSAFSALSGVSDAKLAQMKDTLDNHWVHVKTVRKGPEMPELEVRDIIRRLLIGWMDREEPAS